MRTTKIQNRLKQYILDKLHLLRVEELDLPDHAINEFEDIYHNVLTAEGNSITYKSSYPKYQFLNYIIENKNVLVHGSNNSLISSFEPKESSLFNGRPIKAVFAASDGVWSLFFAVKKREGYIGSLRNLCITVPTKKGIKRYYYFSINNEDAHDTWTNGTIYILPKNSFKRGGISDEWVCEHDVAPVAKLSVTPTDFPFLDKVSTHIETDSALKTILKAMFIKK
ncbi:hypothetical protein H1D32_02435 [Anaerobacillus sp. CMMVII]|uniref:hypothetical protein n=1 Tax=Anaerobacillus sp. CMMVII TaxID=2755588 RepID=UPI0021B736E2|nr:hypothetical protein [Anaerobacillus sp. CMMVII]MCT8136707.1 hypothetical protein [Anaerobacillus sp. CMMVII]